MEIYQNTQHHKIYSMKILKFAPLLLALVFLESCTSTSKTMNQTASGDWTLATMSNSPINRMVVLPTMNIDAENMIISGSGGCNRYSGAITKLNAATLNISDKVRATMMACNNENIETDFLQKLSLANTYEVKNDLLTVFDKNGTNILTFIKKKNSSANQLLHNIWMTTSIKRAPLNRMATIPRLEINLTEMKIFGNDGCNDYNGTITTANAKDLEFGRVASTRKMCADMDITDRYNMALATVASYQVEGLNLYLFDKNGKEVLSFLKVD